ncbi:MULTISPECIES: hypothetical protein [unclassified Facklamia]|uniref:hypothetical protein n=1 Tax=Aerococcaceae TaxID=186827 RepID=UPI001F0757C3|nr:MULTISPECIES: hypothetical protein [unclassified Facklamia]
MKDVTNSSRTERMKETAEKIRNIRIKRLEKWKFKANYLYVLLIVLAAIYYYVTLPAIHYAAIEFWVFLTLILCGIAFIEAIKDGSTWLSSTRETKSFSLKKVGGKYKLLLGLIPLVALVWGVSSLIFSPFFMAKSYSEMLTIEKADFEQEFPEIDVNQIPLVDLDTAVRLGNRRLGALTDLVSQFVPSDEYIQINIKNKPYRVTPLQYAGFFKWLNNFNEGIPHYLKVDNVSGEVTVETPSSPIRYSYSDKFNRYIIRHLRFNYPFALFGKPNFEVDDDGVPYYIATTYSRNFFLFEPEVSGLITVNAMTGETTRYALNEIPSWVDRVYSSELLLHQLQMNGKYKNGFWNTVFSNEGVTQPTDGYTYLPMNDDLYIYTGITSIVSDESNIGFVLINMRTKEAKMYPLTAAEEFSAMSSAEGSVQEKGYKATFPLLINLSGKPMYILSLKDSSGLIKAYALVDVQNYQRVYVESSVEKLLLSYASENPVNIDNLETEDILTDIKGTISQIQAVVKDGNTVYYFMLDGKVYQAPIQLNEQLPFLEAGQAVELGVNEQGAVKTIDW